MEKNQVRKEEKTSKVETVVEKTVDSSLKASTCQATQGFSSVDPPPQKHVPEPNRNAVNQMNGNGLAASPEFPPTASCDIGHPSSSAVEKDKSKFVASSSLSTTGNRCEQTHDVASAITSAVVVETAVILKNGILEGSPRPDYLGNLQLACPQQPKPEASSGKVVSGEVCSGGNLSSAAAEASHSAAELHGVRKEVDTAITNGVKSESRSGEDRKKSIDKLPEHVALRDPLLVNGVTSPESKNALLDNDDKQRRTDVGAHSVPGETNKRDQEKDVIERDAEKEIKLEKSLPESVHKEEVVQKKENSLAEASSKVETETNREEKGLTGNKDITASEVCLKEKHSKEDAKEDEKSKTHDQAIHSSGASKTTSHSTEKTLSSWADSQTNADKPSPVGSSPKDSAPREIVSSASPIAVDEIQSLPFKESEKSVLQQESENSSSVKSVSESPDVATAKDKAKDDANTVETGEPIKPCQKELSEAKDKNAKSTPSTSTEMTDVQQTPQSVQKTVETPIEDSAEPTITKEVCQKAAGGVILHAEQESAAVTHPSPITVDDSGEAEHENIGHTPSPTSVTEKITPTHEAEPEKEDAKEEEQQQQEIAASNETTVQEKGDVSATDSADYASKGTVLDVVENNESVEVSEEPDKDEKSVSKEEIPTVETTEDTVQEEEQQADTESADVAAVEEQQPDNKSVADVATVEEQDNEEITVVDKVVSEAETEATKDTTPTPQETTESQDNVSPKEVPTDASPKKTGAKSKTTPMRSPDKTRKVFTKSYSEKDASSAQPKKSSAKKPSSSDSSPRKGVKNGVTSPSKSARTPSLDSKKLPPIKAPVGLAASPNVRAIKSKIGSLENIKHRPGGGEKKVLSKKLEWNASSKVGSMDNASYKPGGGDKKIATQKLDFKEKAQPKVGSKDLIKHQPGGGNVKIDVQKVEFKEKASPKVGSLDNVDHKPGGGDVKIKTEKLVFKENASSKIGSLPDSDQNSLTQSPQPPVSPNQENSASPMPENNGQSKDEPQMNGVLDEMAAVGKPQENKFPQAAGAPQKADGDAWKC